MIVEFLEKSLEDKKFSRGEKSVLKELLEESADNENHLAWIRHKTFELVKKALKHPHDRDIIEWLEDLMKALNRTTETKESINEAYFFPSHRSLEKLIKWLETARQQLDISVFTITNNEISRVILKLHKKGIKIRIITDDDKSLDLGSDIEDFIQAGIPVRFDDSSYHMHHKFVVIDRKILINGSFNWTRSATNANQENIQITNQTKIVNLFSEQFEKLWKDFSNNK